MPEDADNTRGHHLRRLLTSPLTIGLTAVLAVVALVGVGTQAGFGIGAAAAGGVMMVALIVVWLFASAKAADDFFRAYSAGRGLTRIEGKTSLPPITPLLRKGDERYAEQRFDGALPGDLEGSLCLYTYEDETRDSDGNKQTTYVHFTVVIAQTAGDGAVRARALLPAALRLSVDPLPDVPGLARGPLTRGLRLRARRRLAGDQRQGPQEVGRRARPALRGLRRGGTTSARGDNRARRLLALTAGLGYSSSSPASSSLSASSPTTSKSRLT